MRTLTWRDETVKQRIGVLTSQIQAKQRRQLQGQVTRNESVRTKHDMASGTLTISSKRRLILNAKGTTGGDNDQTVEELITKLRFVPEIGTGRMMWATTVRLEDGWDGTFSSIPRLEVNRILPSDSLVFGLIVEGELEEFHELLRKGEASLRDHDEDGNSLLYVSIFIC